MKSVIRRVCCLLFITCIFLSACSLVELEQAIRGHSPGSDITENQVTESKIDNPDNSLAESYPDYEFYSIGETITVRTEWNEIEYTVLSVDHYDSLADAGLTVEDIVNYNKDDLDNPFVLLSIRVRPVVYYSRNTEAIGLSGFDLLNRACLTDPWGDINPGLVYFYGEEESRGTNYYSMILEEGESADIKIGFLLNDRVHEPEDLFLHVGISLSTPYYVDLEKDINE